MEPFFLKIARQVRVRERLTLHSNHKRIGRIVLVAISVSFLSFAILWLEYGVLNFGDSDLPPYQSDTPLEKVVDGVWFTVTITAGLLWLYSIALVLRALFRSLRNERLI